MYVDGEREPSIVGTGTEDYFGGGLYAVTHAQVTAQLFDVSVSVDAVTWTLIGGAGTVLGPVLGTALVLLFTNAISPYVVYTQIPVGVLLVLIVRFVPQGLIGVWRQWQARRP